MGEAILDLIAKDETMAAFESALGGSSFNTALALGRLGVPSGFAGALARDVHGERFVHALSAAGVHLDFCARSDAPMPLALATPDAATGAPRFSLYLDGTADREPYALPASWPAGIHHLHASSFRCTLGAQGEAALAFMRLARGHASISFDPNIRPSVVPPRGTTVQLIEDRVAAANFVKASEEDMAWLYPDRPPEAAMRRWLALGVELAVLTRGANGASAFFGGETLSSAAPNVDVVDSVGAGDVFSAGLLAAMNEEGCLGPDGPRPERENVARWLALANGAAAMTCARRGAEPPTRAELDTFLRT
ncbi:carbohydrate kinase [Roseiarcaceae bacterium H3SJ34-1]|uniref:carbohydrate kinase family protein n=1 Tax=Terripilifer ovatus TaxID=3032367 RepID=UPI003AB97194|nr:carbohydrate kinase [Roseiarcaceae bacterium H3SJ34-1]